MEKVLIIGAAGFIGKYLTEEILTYGYTVCGSDLKEDNNFSQVVQYIHTDLLDEEQMR